MTRRWALLGLAISACANAPRPPIADPLGLGIYTRPNNTSDVKISPGGTHLAALTQTPDGERALVFFNTEDLTMAGGFRFGPRTIVQRLEWANDQRVVMEVSQADGPLDSPRFYGDIYAIDLDRSNPQIIFGLRAGRSFTTGTHITPTEPIEAWGSILDPLADNAEEILVASQHYPRSGKSVWSRENEPGIFEVFAVAVRSGQRRRVVAGPGHVFRYFTDESGNVGAAFGVSNEQRPQIMVRSNDEWAPLVGPETDRVGDPLGISRSKNELYLIDEDKDGPGLFAIALDSKERRLIDRDPGVEPSRVLLDGSSGAPVAVEYELDYPTWKILDPASPASRILALAATKFPGHHPVITSFTDDGKTAIVWIYADRHPGVYCLVSIDPERVVPLVSARTEFDAASASPMEAVQIAASDGEIIRGYLSTPRRAKGRLPLIVLPHGGPHGIRDRWGYDREAQLFTARGYAVLQVNYRGSGGYGRRFLKAGMHRWGDRVQDDIIEMTRAMIKKKELDPERVCIYGASFGGYSALQSSIRAPDLFRCAIGYAGIYDLRLMSHVGDTSMTRLGLAVMDEYLGSDEAELTAASPIAHVDALKTPVLLIHGVDDRRAPLVHAQRLCDAITAAGKACEHWFVPDEAHGFWDQQHRIELYERILTFLEAHLGAPAADRPRSSAK